MNLEKYNNPNEQLATLRKRAGAILHSIENDYYKKEEVTDGTLVREQLQAQLGSITDERVKEDIEILIEQLVDKGF